MARWSSWIPAGVRGQVAGILLAGLALSQAVAAVLYIVLLPQWQAELRPEEAVTKLDVTIRLLEVLPRDQRAQAAQALDEGQFSIQYLPQGPFAGGSGSRPSAAERDLAARLMAKLRRTAADVMVGAAPERADRKRIQIRLADGAVVSVVTPVGYEHRLGLVEQAAIALFAAIVMTGLWVWLTWRINAPLLRFARAAERVGVDVNAPALPEQGPVQLRRAIRAFNEMQQRLQRLLTDRTLMLGAISHDLRTPLTRLRLRIESGRTAVERDRMLADIESMEAMLTSSLSFVRGVDDAETAEVVDLDLAIQTVCDLLSDLGGQVAYAGPIGCRFRCRPLSLMRALTNVIENGVKYGGKVQVSLSRIAAGGYAIEVTDEGPGLSDEEKTKVFDPFYRTREARSQDGTGMGLGLSIARSIVLAHGGSIELADALPRGLRVRIVLPGTEEGPAGSASQGLDG